MRTEIGDLFRVTGVQQKAGRNKNVTLPGHGKPEFALIPLLSAPYDPSHPYRRGC